MKTGLVITILATCALFVSAHSTAVGVWNEQPTKLAAMEGQYEDEAAPLYLFGWVDEANEEVIGLGIPGFTSILATGSPDTVYPGLNTLAQTEQFSNLDTARPPVNAVFQVYHLMVAVSGVLALFLVLVLVALARGTFGRWKWLQKLMVVAPLFPLVAIEAGWFTAELGRQPWVVYPSANAPGVELLTNEAYSHSVTSVEMWITIILFCAIYLLLFVAWVRIVSGLVKKGPERLQNEPADDAVLDAVIVNRAEMQGESGKAAVRATAAASAEGGE